MKRIKLLLFIFIIFLCVPRVNALEIKSGAIYRKSAINASVSFVSDTDGKYYYKVTNSNEVPSNIKTKGIYGGTISANNIVTFSPTGLTSGKKYVHILVTDDVNEDISTVELTYDFYYFDDFEIYTENSYPLYYSIYYNGNGDANQKIISAEQNNDVNGKVFKLDGLSYWCSDQRINLDNQLGDDAFVFEADSKPFSTYNNGIALGQSGIQWTGAVGAVYLSNNKFFHSIADDQFETNSSKSYNIGEWFHIKIILDFGNRKFDYYINGERMNTEHLNTHSSYVVDYVGISSSNLSYFDNVKFYHVPGSVMEHNITIDTNNHGTINVDKTVESMSNIVTITSITPYSGYELKNIKIKKTSDGTDITNDVDYNSFNKTFVMPDYDVKVVATFKAIEIVNPQTSDNIFINFIIFIISLVCLISCNICIKKEYN